MQKKILVLSSFSPYHSCNLIKDLVDGLKTVGCDVDFVGVDNYEISEEGYFTIGKVQDYRDEPYYIKLRHKIAGIKFVRKCINYFRYRILRRKIGDLPAFLHLDDSKPDVNIEEWESVLPKKKYDLVITTFMRGHITSVTLRYLCEKYRIPLFVYAVDMQPMTGGCYYFHDCNGYKECCKNCFIMHDSQIPYKNFMLKKAVYNTYPIYACGNSYMGNYFRKSGLWNKESYLYLPCVINENLFRIKDKTVARKYFGLSDDAFVIFAGARNLFEERKGMKYLLEAIDRFKRAKREIKLELVLAGNSYGNTVSLQGIRVVMIDHLNIEDLVSMYSAADVFACPGWNDAGPSMVNQAIMCGTPVLAFDTGVAKDIVIEGVTGYKAELKNIDDLARGIGQLYSAISNNPKMYTNNCREYALLHFSRVETAKQILTHLNTISTSYMA